MQRRNLVLGQKQIGQLRESPERVRVHGPDPVLGQVQLGQIGHAGERLRTERAQLIPVHVQRSKLGKQAVCFGRAANHRSNMVKAKLQSF